MPYQQTSYDSPIGLIVIVAKDDILQSLKLISAHNSTKAIADSKASNSLPATESAVLIEAVAQLKAYFERKLFRFDLPLASPKSPRGDILRQAIANIGYGETISYGSLARLIDSGARAVGQACARNPYPLIIPCHRVIGSGGIIGNYSGGEGLITKRYLLNFEAQQPIWS